jgi:hypothetical protein
MNVTAIGWSVGCWKMMKLARVTDKMSPSEGVQR